MLRRAVRALTERGGIRVSKRSAIYETEPLGPAQPRFLNAAVEVQTELVPRELLLTTLAIETQLGRVRDAANKSGPRVIDIDILLYGDEIVAEPDLIVPHPELHRRGFALAPLVDIAADLEHPALGRPLRELLQETGLAGVTRTEEPLT
jgi:2-amino-4-hydroxy-6-hydroxymethyldihydropteridine diphosphokinase